MIKRFSRFASLILTATVLSPFGAIQAAVKSNSYVRTGVNVAVIDLTRFDNKKPKAKIQNMIMLLFTLVIIYKFLRFNLYYE